MVGKKLTLFEIIVGIAAIVACVAAVFVVPEFRQWVGLERSNPPETPTMTPTPKAECPSGITCYDDNFSELNPARWCKIPNEGIDFKNNQLFVSAPAETSRELHPCEFLDSNLKFVELTLNIIQADGYAGNAHSGIGASLNNDEYLYPEITA